MANKTGSKLTVSQLFWARLKEDMAMSVGSGAVAGMPTKDTIPPVPAGVTTKSSMLRRAAPNLGNKKVFPIPSPKFRQALLNKKKYAETKDYNDLSQQVTEYVRLNPDAPVLIEDESTGAIIYLRYGKFE